MKRMIASALVLIAATGCAAAERDREQQSFEPPAAVVDEPVIVTVTKTPADGAEVLD